MMAKAWKRALVLFGLLWMLPGVPLAFGYLLVVPLLTLSGEGTTELGMISFVGMVWLLGIGCTTLWHSAASLDGKPSRPTYLPPAWALMGLFGICVAWGLIIAVPSAGFFAALLFPPALVAAALLPPLWAVAWFTRGEVTYGVTWRRALLALCGGATLSVLAALLLEIATPVVIMALVLDLADAVVAHLGDLFDALWGQNLASAVTSPGFVYVFVQIAVIAPLAEELVKPLATLPLLRRTTRRDAFLLGALAGAGFAALENVLYTGFGSYWWAGVLLVRALGGAVHPLGSGLVALAWRDVLRREPGAGRTWLLRYGLAVGVHALWNGSSLLVLTLAGVQFFGAIPPEIDVLGLSAAGTTLALLVVLGLGALSMGRALTGRLARTAHGQSAEAALPADVQFVLADRTVAIWALACLVVIVPAGVAGLRLLLW